MTQSQSDFQRAPDEQTFRLMFDGHAAVMFLIEPETGAILDANQAAVDFYGYPKSKLCGMSIQEINTLPLEQVEAERQKAFQEERNHFIFPHRLASGEERIVEVHSSPITFGEKRVLFSIIHDITKRKRAETALKKSEARYRAVTQSAHEAIITADSAGNIVGWNNGAGIIFGYSEAEVSGQPLTMLMSARFRDKYRAGMMRAQTPGAKNIIGKTVEVVGQHKNGSEFPLEHSLSEWQDDDDRFYTAIIRDITGRKQAEERIRQIANELRVTLDTVTVGISHIQDRKVKRTNATYDEMFGYSLGETHGMETSAFYLDHASFERLGQEAYPQLLAGKTYRADMELRKRDGSRFWCSLTGRAVNVAQPAEGSIWMLEDISERKRTEDALRWNQTLLQLMSNSSPLGFLVVDNRSDDILYFNTRFCEIWGIEHLSEQMQKGELKNKDIIPACLAVLVDVAAFAESCKPLQDEANRVVVEDEIAFTQGRTVRRFSTQIRGENDEYYGRFYIFEEITERKRIQQELQAQRDFATQIVNTMGQGLTVTDSNGRFEFVNPAYARLFGYETADLLGKHPEDVTTPEHRDILKQQRQARISGKTTAYETDLRRADGSIASVLITGVPRGHDGQYAGAIAVITDLTEQKRIENELRRAKDALEQALIREQKLARTDALTDLNNRGYLFELAAREFEVAVRYQKPLAVMMFDIDNFKEINDIFGHPIGDQALIHVSQTILAILRAPDILGRYGGDEFSIVLPHTSAQNAFSLARRIHARLAAARIETEKGSFTVTISIGIAQTIYGVTSPPDTVEDLFWRADQALYAAKQAGKNRSVIFESKEQ